MHLRTKIYIIGIPFKISDKDKPFFIHKLAEQHIFFSKINLYLCSIKHQNKITPNNKYYDCNRIKNSI